MKVRVSTSSVFLDWGKAGAYRIVLAGLVDDVSNQFSASDDLFDEQIECLGQIMGKLVRTHVNSPVIRCCPMVKIGFGLVCTGTCFILV